MSPDNQPTSEAAPQAPAAEAAPATDPARKSYEEWALAKAPEAWALAAARTLADWPQGREVTEAEFDEAIRAATAIQIGY